MNAAAPMPKSRLDSDRKIDADRSHEPSMDEILASIRRIISEDQAQLTSRSVAPIESPVALPAQAAPPIVEPHPVQAASIQSSRNVTSSELGSAVERLRRALEPAIAKTTESSILGSPVQSLSPASVRHREPAPEDPVPSAAPSIRPVQVKLPEFELRAAIDQPVAPPPVEGMKPDPFVSPAPEISLDMRESTLAPQIEVAKIAPEMKLSASAAPHTSPPFGPFPSLDRAFPGPTSVLGRISTAAPAPPVPPAVEDEDFESQAPDSGVEGLLSPSADASIASSFQTLATSMLFQDKGLVEEMVREMLRPMLKNWLDDNLPVMVERLVRTEIERVARGGRG